MGEDEEWKYNADGVLFRRGARVIILDPQGRVLLVRGHDNHAPADPWWFLVGGGILPGETAVAAAVRETWEEVGLHLEMSELVGPVILRSALFQFASHRRRQDEEIFLYRLVSQPADGVVGGEEIRNGVLDEARWFSFEDMEREPLQIYPRELNKIVLTLFAGWDGSVIHINETDD